MPLTISNTSFPFLGVGAIPFSTVPSK
uniref:Uncharacterized protein n=1 Tax=Arundo donax TaxID=35708 RepID=A0A0A9A654_ARUDO